MKVLRELFRLVRNNHGNVGFLGSEGNNGDGGNADPNASAGAGNGTDGGQISFPADFDESLKGNKSLLKFYDQEKKAFNFANLAKSYVNMETLLGKDKIPVPHKEFTEDQWGEFYDKLGRPAREKYEVKNNVAENFKADDQFFNKYLDVAHKTGLLPKQAQAVVDFFNGESANIMKAEADAKKAELQKSVEGLQKEWGDKYKNNLNRASEALFEFASDEELASMKESGLLDNPTFTKLFYKIADSLKEDKFKSDVRNSFDQSRDQVQEEIQSYYRADHPFMQRNHPQAKFYQEKMLQLQRKLLKMN